jgi:DNA-binding HxlR family transcriptional regulator
LQELQKLGIIKRKIVSESPIRIEYTLTDMGKQLEPILFAAASFSMSCLPKIVFKDEDHEMQKKYVLLNLNNPS